MMQEMLSHIGLNAVNAAKPDLTTDLADLLYDIKEKREDVVPEFDDNILNWLKFKNMFEMNVHNKRIPNLHKFSILIKKIKRKEGKAILDGINYDPANYDNAWGAIKKQFHHQAMLVRIEIEEFNSQPAIPSHHDKKGATARNIVHKSNRFWTNIRAIFTEGTTLDEEKLRAEVCNATFMHTLEGYMDERSKLSWGQTRKNKRQVARFEVLIAFLEQRADNMDYYQTKGSNQDRLASGRDRQHFKKMLMASTVNTKGKPCVMCQNPHPLEACTKFCQIPVKGRWDFILKNKICGNCFKHPYSREDPCRSQRSQLQLKEKEKQ